MEINILQERNGDLPAILDLTERAFRAMPESDHQEHLLVGRLHDSETFIPELSLVAETDEGIIAGYILLPEVEIVSENGIAPSLAVAPLAVLPEYQGKGIGGLLLKSAHKKAAGLGYGSAVLLGHKDYYPRFGYREAMEFGIRFPFDVPSEYCQAIELQPDALNGVTGTVRYPAVFFG